MPVFRKDPDALLDYKADWTQYLGSDSIVSADASAVQSLPAITSAGEIRIASQGVSGNSLSHVIWLSAGAAGKEYSITSRIHTSGGKRDDRSFIVRVESR